MVGAIAGSFGEPSSLTYVVIWTPRSVAATVPAREPRGRWGQATDAQCGGELPIRSADGVGLVGRERESAIQPKVFEAR
jgi:hypothetical protein